MKKTHLIGILVIAIAIAAIVSTFSDSSSYASFAESKETNKEIHVVGKLQKEKEMVYNPVKDANYFSFYVKDQKGEECKVRITEVKRTFALGEKITSHTPSEEEKEMDEEVEGSIDGPSG